MSASGLRKGLVDDHRQVPLDFHQIFQPPLHDPVGQIGAEPPLSPSQGFELVIGSDIEGSEIGLVFQLFLGQPLFRRLVKHDFPTGISVKQLDIIVIFKLDFRTAIHDLPLICFIPPKL
jgi:hypothetical protein